MSLCNAVLVTVDMSPDSAAGLKREDDLKVREKAIQNMHMKGAFTAQELYDGHKGTFLHIATYSN